MIREAKVEAGGLNAMKRRRYNALWSRVNLNLDSSLSI